MFSQTDVTEDPAISNLKTIKVTKILTFVAKDVFTPGVEKSS